MFIKKRKLVSELIGACLAVCLLTGCIPAGEAVPGERLATTAPPEAQATTPGGGDLFPDKTELRHAKAFTVEYHDTYKLVTVAQPWRDAGRTFQYVLVPRGVAPPAEAGQAQVIEIPIESIASLSTTHLPYLDSLEALDSLVAVGNTVYINTPGVLARLQSAKIQGVGNGPEVNLEALLELQPEVITTLALGNSKKDDYQQLLQKGFKVVIVSDYMEETPLGRAEWVKFMALFYNQEALAEAKFSQVEQRYQAMVKLAAGVSEKPAVVMGYEINGTWNMPGGNSYQAAYVRDAGGDYLWADDDSTGRIPLSFEEVFDKAVKADYWFNQSVSWLTAADVLGADPRYEKFAAFSGGRAYNNNARVNETGGNDYNESGHANPDVILADLIAILHPELLPDHSLVYYQRLE